MSISISGNGTFTGATADYNFDQSVGIAGTLTYEDVTSIDSVGIITARQGLDTPTNLVLRTGGSERMRIDSSGNLLIGGTLPSAPNISLNADGTVVGKTWEVYHPQSSSSFAKLVGNAFSQAGNAPYGSSLSIQMGGNSLTSSTGQALINVRNEANTIFGVRSDGTVVVGGTLINTNTQTPKIALNADGSAEFAGAITAPNITLSDDGSATFANSINAGERNPAATDTRGVRIAIDSSNGGCYVQAKSSSTPSSLMAFQALHGTTEKFKVLYDGSATFAGSVTASNVSDIRFKENITDANPQLADAVALGSQLKNFDWKDDAPLNEELRAKRFLGLVAQEAEKVCPSLTYTVPRTKQGAELTPETTDAEGVVTPATYEELDDSYKAINHDILVMKLLGAVAEQNTQIETLEQRLTDAGIA